MTKICVLLSLLYFSKVESQIIYRLQLTNLSRSALSVRLNSESIKKIAPNQSLAILDSIDYYQFQFVEVEIASESKNVFAVKKIPFLVINKSEIELKINDPFNTELGKGYQFEGLPFEDEQQRMFNLYYPAKNAFDTWEKEAYKNYYKLPANFQRDSVGGIIKQQRIDHLQFVSDFITSIKNSHLAYYLFDSEFSSPKNVMTIGKQAVISIFQTLDSSYYKTEIGKKNLSYVSKMKANTVGSVIPNFKFRTRDFSEHDLFEYIGDSQALLIFTMKSCKACVEQIPKIKEIEMALNPAIKIIYVTLDRSEKEWDNHLQKVKYPGIMTINISPYNYTIDLKDLFMVTFVPQIFLIDKNHEILYDNLSPSEDDDLIILKQLLGLG
jgi:hypothetical protein